MRGDLQENMQPMAPLASMPLHAKPKVDFSIDSIVGKKSVEDQKVGEESSSVVYPKRPVASPPPAHSAKTSSQIYRDMNADVLRRTQAESPFVARTTHVPGPLGVPYQHPAVLPYATDALSALYSPHHPHFPISPYYMNREYQNYPWILNRQPRLLPYRPQGPQAASFILHQFRKPKRIRTAFSPSQLLTLEHAFEKNHYVVGAERKQLAQDLNLTETQVKVWFQNRRTKHKRQKQEEEQNSQNSNEGSNVSESESQLYSLEAKDNSDESDCESRASSDITERSPS